MEFVILYEDKNLLVIDKPPGIVVFPENKTKESTLIDLLLKKFVFLKNVGRIPRYGIVHRLDKDTSGILLVAKNNKTLKFLQKQFKERKIIKKYIALVIGDIKETKGWIKTLIGRSKKNWKKQKVYLSFEPDSKGKREAETYYKVLKKFKNYSLLEISPITGRKHQIRVHLSYISHPIAGDKIYSFKNQKDPKGLKRQFLHASYLKIKLPDGKIKELRSKLPDDLKDILKKIKVQNEN